MLFFSIIFVIASLRARQVEPFREPHNNALIQVACHCIHLTFGAALAIEMGMSRSLNDTVFGLVLVAINIAVLIIAATFLHRRFTTEQRARDAERARRAIKVEWCVVL